ncbi:MULTISPECIES: PP2C family protein-serine/threonine phosphatase [Streptomyces]|uniref:PP2C family protein-serine/threonine phosphatase n=1 Tax=Streptomyces TaxID=1883 RepID=UPI00117C632D|nr:MULTISPECIES: PP2C family protein-serine/threonine phosphatase [unclassified Streptomyces]WTE30101.1 serine/threonine-protein phosphatase [Streptomyces anulatus]
MRHLKSSLPRGAVDRGGICAVLAVALVDVVTGDEARFLPAYAIGPAVSTRRGTQLAVIGTGMIAALAAAHLALSDGTLATRGGLSALTVIVLFTGFAAVAAKHRRRQETHLAATRRVAHAAQHAIAPPLPAAHGPVRMAASYASADPHARIGGDLCEVVPIKNGVRILIGDVQGKGLGTVALSTALLGAFRESAPSETHLETIGLRMSCALLRRPDEERFATLALVELTSQGHLTALNYGHPSPHVINADDTPLWADTAQSGLPLGLAALADSEPGRHSTTLRAGDRVLFHTDGLTEARDPDGRFYPLDERTAALRDAPLETCLERLRADIQLHTASGLQDAHDDSALLLVEFDGAPAQNLPGLSRHPALEHAPATPSVEDLGCTVCAVTACPLRTTIEDRRPNGI